MLIHNILNTQLWWNSIFYLWRSHGNGGFFCIHKFFNFFTARAAIIDLHLFYFQQLLHHRFLKKLFKMALAKRLLFQWILTDLFLFSEPTSEVLLYDSLFISNRPLKIKMELFISTPPNTPHNRYPQVLTVTYVAPPAWSASLIPGKDTI